MEANKTLVKEFFRSASKLLADDGGEIHVAHKTLEPFCWWGLGALGKESACGIEHVASLVFDRMLFPGYVNRKALHRKSFPSHDAQVYVFKKTKKKTKEEGKAGGDGDITNDDDDDDDGNHNGSDNQPAWLQEKCHALNAETVPALEGRIKEVLAKTKTKIEESRKRKRGAGWKK
jgi:hypothetical protein